MSGFKLEIYCPNCEKWTTNDSIYDLPIIGLKPGSFDWRCNRCKSVFTVEVLYKDLSLTVYKAVLPEPK